MRVAILWCLVGLRCLSGQSPAPSELIEHGTTEIREHKFNDNPVGVWSGGALVVVENARSASPVFQIFDKAGRKIGQVNFAIAGASRINIYSGNFAHGFDGSLAIAGSAYTDDSRGAAFLAYISPDGLRQTILRVSPYAPRAVTVAADGTIWTAGHELVDGKEPSNDYDVIRRFDNTGKLIGSYVPRSQLKMQSGYTLPDDYSYLAATSDGRVGWYSEASREYMEFSQNGELRSQSGTAELHDGKKTVYGLAMCDGGTVFVSASWIEESSNRKWAIFVRDSEHRTWKSIPRNENWGMLYGCDGTTLASRTEQATIRWLRQAASK